MRKISMRALLVIGAFVFLRATSGKAQQTAADTIIYNAKIITVDDHGFTSRLGTIAQAMHIKDGKILHLGSNSQIRAMAGPNTKVIDLKGRTVIPGFILTHEHPWDWNPVEPIVTKHILTDDVVVTRFIEGSAEDNLKAFPGVLAEAVSKAKPGQWIYIVFTMGRKYEFGVRGNGPYGVGGLRPDVFNVLDGRRILKAQLDAAAPNNPVVLRDVFISLMLNRKAIDESRKVFPWPDVNGVSDETGLGASMRWMFADVMMKDHYPKLVELMRLGLEWWAGYGMTTFSSNAYDPANLQVYTDLDRNGKMPIREMWTWNWRTKYFYSDPYYLTFLNNFEGRGSDYLWFGGGRIIEGAACTMAPVLGSSRLAKMEEFQIQETATRCAYDPGSDYANLLYDYIKAGNRYVNHHTVGDRDIDNILEIIQRASKDAGMTEEQIRAKRHALDHGEMFPRPDQVNLFKKLGIHASGNVTEIYQGAPAIFDVYGERGTSWLVPKKRLSENGIYNTLEMDRALGSTDLTIFSGISWMINRKAWDGKVYAADQRVDRETALKIATIWGAYYVFREKILGSLEPGKAADFLVLDRDYLTVPEDDIANLRVMMTVVGGKVVHLVPSLAKEFDMQAAGSQVTLGGPAAQW